MKKTLIMGLLLVWAIHAFSVTNDSIQHAFEITDISNWVSQPAEFTTTSATQDSVVSPCSSYDQENSVWFTFDAVSDGISVKLFKGTGDGTNYGNIRYPIVTIYDEGFTPLNCNYYPSSSTQFDSVMVSAANLTPGSKYYISVDNKVGYPGAFTLNVNDGASNDFVSGAIELVNINNWTSELAEFTTLYATPDGTPSGCGPALKNVWFTFTATSNGVTATLFRGGNYGTMSNNNPVMTIYDENFVPIACIKKVITDSLVLSTDQLAPNTKYYLTVDNAANQTGSFTLKMQSGPNYDFPSGAYEIANLNNWQSVPSKFTTDWGSQDTTISPCSSYDQENSVWFTFDAVSDGISVKLFKGTGDGTNYGNIRYPIVTIYDEGFTPLNCNYYPSSSTQFDSVMVSAANLTPGSKYYISVDNKVGYPGAFTLNVNDGASNDFVSGAIELVNINNWTSELAEFTTLYATPDGTPSGCGPALKNVWFTFTATSNGVTATLFRGGNYGTMSNNNPVMTIYDENFVPIACIKKVITDSLVLSTDQLAPNTKYYLTVDNAANQTGSFTLKMQSGPNYDFPSGAYEIANLNNWQSVPSKFTTDWGSQDTTISPCSSYDQENSVWFTFDAVSDEISVKLLKGTNDGVDYGTIRYPIVTIYDEGFTPLNCSYYPSSSRVYDSVSVSAENLQPNNKYYISVDNKRNYAGSFSLYLNSILNNNDLAQALELPAQSNYQSPPGAFSLEDATHDAQTPSCAQPGQDNNVWFTFNATSGESTIKVITGGENGTLANPVVTLYDASQTELSCSNTMINNEVAINSTGLVQGNQYYISVSAAQADKGTFTLDIQQGNPDKLYAIASGNWSDNIWSYTEGGEPAANTTKTDATVHIKGYTVTVTSAEQAKIVALQQHTNNNTQLIIDNCLLELTEKLEIPDDENENIFIELINNGNFKCMQP